MIQKATYGLLLLLILIFQGCAEDPFVTDPELPVGPEQVVLEVPQRYQNLLPPPNIPPENPLTQAGVKLGRMLFYDPILSKDSTQSCASCHGQDFSFTDHGLPFSVGVEGQEGIRNAMPIINLAWSDSFFWDGRAPSLEVQALDPVPDPIEMHGNWFDIMERLERHPEYPELFREAFGEISITPTYVVRAIAQFERTVISFGAPFDEAYALSSQLPGLSAAARRGWIIFNSEAANGGGDCFHCHSPPVLFTNDQFINNGLDSTYANDKGLFRVTGDPNDIGRFKVPTLRNLLYTAPYMHDGRFETLEEVMDFYSEGVIANPYVDPLMKEARRGGVHLTEQQKQDLLAFLITLTDPDFDEIEEYSNPFE